MIVRFAVALLPLMVAVTLTVVALETDPVVVVTIVVTLCWPTATATFGKGMGKIVGLELAKTTVPLDGVGPLRTTLTVTLVGVEAVTDAGVRVTELTVTKAGVMVTLAAWLLPP